MAINNLTRRKILAKSFETCSSIFSKAKGLMFSSRQKKALVFPFGSEKIISLHMLFVFYPIDVLFLDKNKIVVDMKKDFSPFTFYSSKKKVMYAVEMPSGTIKKSKTGIGDKISF